MLIITDLSLLVNSGNLSERDTRLLIEQGPAVGIVPIFAGMRTQTISSTTNQVKLVRQLVTQILYGGKLFEQDIVSVRIGARREPQLKAQESYVLENGEWQLVQMLEAKS